MIGYVDDLATFKLFGAIFPTIIHMQHIGVEGEREQENERTMVY